jgi:DNA-binding protein H-NS
MSTLQELLAQREALESQIEQMRSAERNTALNQAKELIQTFGLTSEELFGGGQRKKKTTQPVTPKYRHPETGATWSGRGKPPAWIAGQDRDYYLIQK